MALLEVASSFPAPQALQQLGWNVTSIFESCMFPARQGQRSGMQHLLLCLACCISCLHCLYASLHVQSVTATLMLLVSFAVHCSHKQHIVSAGKQHSPAGTWSGVTCSADGLVGLNLTASALGLPQPLPGAQTLLCCANCPTQHMRLCIMWPKARCSWMLMLSWRRRQPQRHHGGHAAELWRVPALAAAGSFRQLWDAVPAAPEPGHRGPEPDPVCM